jgi:hypothetical protein
MRIFNRVFATILSLLIIAGTLTGIIYLVGLIAGSNTVTRPLVRAFSFLAGISTGQIAAALVGLFIISMVLFILEVKPSRLKLITVSEGDFGTTKVFKSDIESYLADHLARERRTITPRRMDVIVLDDYRFNVDTDVAVSTTADREEVKEQVRDTIKSDLAVIGLDKELERINSQVEKVKRVA